MAGIGFELKKLFQKKGIFALLKAYGYAGIVCTGPMILGILLLLGVRILAAYGGADEHSQELLNCMITYTLLASLAVSSMFSMVTTRFIADALYEEKNELVMPSFHGSVSIMLGIGSVLYGIFLWNAGISITDQLLCLILFGELVVVWTEINYLTAIKDYQNILLTFFFSLSASLLAGYVLIVNGQPPIPSLLCTMTLGYGIMMVWYYSLLLQYFPKGAGSSFHFLKWIDRCPALAVLGILMVSGLFAHLVLMWFSPVGIQIQGSFYGAPSYDIPALFAFLSILITTINFVTSVEVNFYPKYRNYFSLFNDGGSLTDILQAEEEMKVTLVKELEYTFTKQVFTTIVFIIGGTILLPRIPMSFSDETLGIYRVLCVGYAFYAIGNCIMLIQLYFADNRGALVSGTLFAAFSILGTVLLMNGSIRYYGFGFMAGGAAFSVYALLRLGSYLQKLGYHVLCRQPVVFREKRTFITDLSEYLDRRYENKYLKGENACVEK